MRSPTIANITHTCHLNGKRIVLHCQSLVAAITLSISILLSFASAVQAAVPGLPFTEDFTDTALQDPALTSGDWNTDEEALLIAKFKRRFGAFDAATGSDVGSAQDTRSLALADMDGDGDIDVMEGNANQTNRLFLNNGTPDPFIGVTGIEVGSVQATFSLALADIDGDGNIDMMEGNGNSQANLLFLNNGTPDPFNGVTGIEVGSAQDTRSLALADIDGDGDLDMLESNLNQANRLFLNNGTADPFNGVVGNAVGSAQGTLSLALADMDGDGDIDVMEGNGNSQANLLFLNNGTSDPFSGITGIEVGSAQSTLSLALADMDGDGDIDVLEGNENQANRLFLNNGTADPFNGVTGIEVGGAQNSLSLALADLDGDGDIDVMAGNGSSQANLLFLNNGTADPFSGITGIEVGSAQTTFSLALADIDGDGDIDVMEGNENQANRLFLNNGAPDPFNGVTGIELGSGQTTFSLALADIDGDGDIDVMEGNFGQPNRLFLNNGTPDPFFGVIPFVDFSAQSTFSLALADMDGDGDIDMMEGNFNQANRLFLNNGTPDPFNGVTPIDVGTAQDTRSLALADIDGDGDIDVMEGNENQANRLFLNNGGPDPFFGVTPIEVGSALETSLLVLADIDGDDDIDVMEGSYGSTQANRLFLNNGTVDPFNGVTGIEVGSAQDTTSLALADMDGDGDIDVMEGNTNQVNRLFLNNGTANPFNSVTPIAVGSAQDTYWLTLADIDGDGNIDVLEGTTNVVEANRLFLNNGTADPFNGVTGIEVGSAQNTFSLALADIDGDGDIDVMEGNSSNQVNHLFLNSGGANPFNGVTPLVFGTALETYSMMLADMDGDGDIDVMEGNYGQANRLFLNNGTANPFNGVTPIEVGSAQDTYSLALADIDGDGDIDVMEGNFDQPNRLFLNNGTANPFDVVTPIEVGSAQFTLTLALADIDGDGDIDVMEGTFNQANLLFLNNGGPDPFIGVIGIAIGSEQDTWSLALADFDGDGDIDVMEGNYNQTNRLTLNNGTPDPFDGVAGILVGSAQNTLSLALADIDGDGDIDVMEGNDGQVNRLFLNDGTADPFDGVVGIEVGSAQDTWSVALADIDEDGDIDVIEGNLNQANRLFLNNATADPFTDVTGIDVGSAQNTHSLALADIDGDGHLDVIEGNNSQGNRLFVRRLFDTARNQGGSLAVDDAVGNVTQVLLSADVALGDLSANSGVDFYLSNNGGLQWFLVRVNKPFIFPTTGSDLRWRAELRSLSPILSPRVNHLTITTDLSAYDIMFKNGFEDPQ